MTQGSLFDFQGRPVVRPAIIPQQTRREAHEAIQKAKGDLHRQVLDALRSAPLTDEQLVDLLGWNPSTLRPRRIELVAAGLVRAVGEAKTRSGRAATLWGIATP